MSSLRVSVVIPVKDDPGVFRAVESVLGCGLPDEAEVLVVDNASTGAFRRRLERLPSRVRVVDEPTPGPAAARNRGVREATGDVILFTDADAVVAPGWVRCGVQALEESGAKIVSGPVIQVATTRAAAALLARTPRWDKSRRQRLGVPVDTANLGVLRRTMTEYPFDEMLLRIEDATWGSRAAVHGLRACTAEGMSVEHQAEEHFAGAVNKAITTGWSNRASKLRWPEIVLSDVPGVATGRRTRFLRRAHGRVCRRSWWIRGEVRVLLLLASTVERGLVLIPSRVSAAALDAMIEAAASLGSAMHAAGYECPAVSDVQKRRIRRRPARQR